LIHGHAEARQLIGGVARRRLHFDRQIFLAPAQQEVDLGVAGLGRADLLPDDGTATGLRGPNYAKCETVGPLHKSHLKARIGRLPSTTWPAIDAGLCRVLAIRMD
jgi:hypothetical protein